MKCPVCREHDLVMTSREGIEIDYCPHCRGVWLDRGELDKIIERSVGAAPPAASHRPTEYSKHSGHKPMTPKNLLKEIFDF